MLAYKTYVQATDEFDLLGQPYTNYCPAILFWDTTTTTI